METKTATVIIVIVVALSAIIMHAWSEYEKSYRAMIDKGYVQKQCVGHYGYIWVKEKQNGK